MKWFLLFLVANILDAGFTHYLIVTGYPVEEVGPVTGPVLEEFGWGGVWVFKILTPIALFALLHVWRTRKSRDRIIKVVSIALLLVVSYSIGMMAYFKVTNAGGFS